MFEVNEDMIGRMVKEIVREADPEMIVLFGSRQRGEAGPESDVDLMVIEREPFGPHRSRRQELLRIRQALSSFRAPKDILLYSLPELEQWRNSLNHIIADILKEGRTLYERP